MLVQEFLENSAECYPDKIALVCEGLCLTYAEIEASANRLAHAMIDHGVQRGDRVAIYLNNSVGAVIGIFATLKAGGVIVPINATTKAEKLAYLLNNCRATALLVDRKRAGIAESMLVACPSVKFTVLCGPGLKTVDLNAVTAPVNPHLLDFWALQIAYPGHRPPCVTIDLDLACLIYTSGTTGDPKGVMSDHGNVVFASGSIMQYLGNVPDDVVINVLPLSFDYGLYQLFMTFRFGGRLVLESSFAYPAAILQQMACERVTGFPGVPTIFAMLLRMDLSPYDLSSLRYLTNTAAALPTSHIQELRDKFHWARLYSMYGLTETKRTLYLPPEQLDRRPGSVGIAIPGTEVWLEDDKGVHLEANQVGELVVRGRHVMRGYWEDPVASAERFRPGPLPGERLCYTGDLFSKDEEGYLYFIGRKDDIIKSRGEKVSPKEVENVLYGLKGIVEAAVIGVQDPILGQAVKAVIVPNGTGLTETVVLAHCRLHLEDYMVPKYVEFRCELPKTASGKIKKTALS